MYLANIIMLWLTNTETKKFHCEYKYDRECLTCLQTWIDSELDLPHKTKARKRRKANNKKVMLLQGTTAWCRALVQKTCT